MLGLGSFVRLKKEGGRQMEEFMRAPLGVQLNRLALLLFLAFACLGVIEVGAFMSAEGIALLAVIGLSSLAAIRLSCTRTRMARLAMVIVVVFVPAVFATGAMSKEANPKSQVVFFGYLLPIGIASLLFLRKKDNDYFTAKPHQSPAAADRPTPIPANQLHCLRIATPNDDKSSPN